MMNKLMWPGMLIVLVVSIMAVDITMLIIATNDESFAVVNEYTEGGENTPHRVQQDLNRGLGWSVTPVITRDRSGTGLIELTVEEEPDRPLIGARVTIKAFHKAFASRSFAVTLHEITPGVYGGSFPVERFGLWRLHMRIERGDEMFVDDFDHPFEDPEHEAP